MGSNVVEGVLINTHKINAKNHHGDKTLLIQDNILFLVTITASSPSMVQLQLKVAHVTNSGKGKDSKLEASVNGVKLTTETRNITSYQWHNVVVELPIDFVKQGTNKVVYVGF